MPVVRLPIPARSGNAPYIVATWLSSDGLSPADGLMIDGYLECTMAHHQKNVAVGKRARVKGDLCANKVTVFGQLVGNIHSDGVVLLAKGSDVIGDIHCACLYIEEGAEFRGRIEMVDPGVCEADRREAGIGQ